MWETANRRLQPVTRLLACGLLVLACGVACKGHKSIDGGASGKALLEAVKLGDNRKVALLLGEGVYTEVRDEKGDTPLLYAVKTGNFQVVRMMLQEDVDREARSGNGRGPLELALDSGNREMVRCLLEYGISPDEIGHDNNPLLLKAVRFGDLDTVHLLFQRGVAPGAAGKDGRTALHVAAEGGLLKCMDALLAAGADPDARDDKGGTPLWLAMDIRRPAERGQVLKRLLKAGADVNIPGPQQRFLLGEAIRRRYFKEAVDLVNYGANVDNSGGGAPSPLVAARAMGSDEMVAMLLSRGADGSALLDEAIKRSDIALVRMLLEFGARATRWTGSDRNHLVASCVRKGQRELAELCLQQGADPNLRGSEGQRPLHMAIALRDPAMVRVLLDYGADANRYFARPVSKAFLDLTEKESMRWFLKNERRVTPLMMAVNNGDLAIIASLMDHGAKKFVCSGRHRLYPLNFASRRGDVKAMQIILGQDPENELYHAVLDLSDQRLRFYNAKGEVLLNSRVSTGKSGFRTPKGIFVITDKHKQHYSTIYGSSMPYFQRLSCSAFGFHAGSCPGYPASHGCIRMPYSAAKRLFALAPLGTRVVIRQ